jgi:cell division protein FtsB
MHDDSDATLAALQHVHTSRRLRRQRIVRWSVSFLAVALLVDALLGDGGFLALWAARRTGRNVAGSISRLRQENAGLRQEIRRLHDDAPYIEGIARRDLGLVREGEIIFVLPPRAPKVQPVP